MKYGTICHGIVCILTLNMFLLAFACEAQVRLLIISLSALVKATAAFHRGLAGSFVYKEGDRNRPLRLRVMCFSQTAISSES